MKDNQGVADKSAGPSAISPSNTTEDAAPVPNARPEGLNWTPIGLAGPWDCEIPDDAMLLVWDRSKSEVHLIRCGDKWPGSPNISHWAELECPFGNLIVRK